MPSLLELQERFAATLESRGPAASPGHGIYREAIGANYRRALAATYRAVRTIVGARAFDAAVDGYGAAHPPLSGDLNLYGGDFAAFLEGHATAASCPWLADLARVEWAVDEAARSADATMTPAEVVAALSILEDEAVEDARLVLHPSCRLLESTYNV